MTYGPMVGQVKTNDCFMILRSTPRSKFHLWHFCLKWKLKEVSANVRISLQWRYHIQYRIYHELLEERKSFCGKAVCCLSTWIGHYKLQNIEKHVLELRPPDICSRGHNLLAWTAYAKHSLWRLPSRVLSCTSLDVNIMTSLLKRLDTV